MHWSLGTNEVEDVRLALRIARETVEGYAYDLERIAAALRAGESVAPFVDGEGGAVAAERLAASHSATADRLLVLEGNLEDDEARLVGSLWVEGVRS